MDTADSMLNHYSEQFISAETTCGSLMGELQIIWVEVGKDDGECDTMLFELEQECLKVYMKKVDEAKECRTKLQHDIAIAKVEISDICTSIGKSPVHFDLKPGENLKEELETINPVLGDMRRKKEERINQFVGVLEQIQKISNEILGPKEQNGNKVLVDETNLSLRRLEELHTPEPEITEPNMLSIDLIINVEEEVSRLEQLKTSRMKENVLKKKVELEDMCRRTHMVMEAHVSMDYSIEAMESGKYLSTNHCLLYYYYYYFNMKKFTCVSLRLVSF